MAAVVAANRSELVALLFPFGGVYAEVGVQRGRFAREIRGLCAPKHLYLVDCWAWQSGEYERDPANRPNEIREQEYAECLEHFGNDPGATMLRERSPEAARHFCDGELDAVYLDADHTLLAVREDLRAWWPKVRSGGIMAGDDYVTDKPWIDVVTAVDEFVYAHNLELLVSGGEWPAWAVRKP